jgi:hypothetical protein
MLPLALLVLAFAPNLNPVAWSMQATRQRLVIHASIAERYKLLRITVKSNTVRLGKPVLPAKLAGEIDIPVPYTGSGKLELEVRYQACSDEICLPPTTRLLTADPVL